MPTSGPPYTLLPTDIEGIDSLAELALDLRWSWSHIADDLWHQLDGALWKRTHNPWVVLQSASRDQIEKLLGSPTFRATLDSLVQSKRRALQTPAWFQRNHPTAALNCIAYFSMEFMLSEALPIYSGGLGNVAGDQLKAASDLGVPVVGVGLLYSQGYFRQVIDANGVQQALFPYNDPGQLPITPLRKSNGEWLRLNIDMHGQSVSVRAWHVQVGRTTLYLLDSNDAANSPAMRGITGELYGGGPELRLQQEILLGIGGWRLLEALCINPDVCHLNEGHAALAVLERAGRFMARTGVSFDAALFVTRSGNLFTTHTAVAAGFDRFEPKLIEHYLGAYAGSMLGLTPTELLGLGRENPADSSESFNMAYLAVRGCGAVNAVSRLHGDVSRRIFAPLFPRWPIEEVPIGYVTNGVHTPSWDSAAADALWTEACGKNRWREPLQTLERDIRCVSDAQLWNLRSRMRELLVNYARERLIQSSTLDPYVLTLGFARRFATYKRPNLLLHDPERLTRLLTNPDRPVQLILAGKAHPADGPGQDLIRQWIEFINRPSVQGRVIFLPDYDMFLTEQLVQGVDVWINTSRRPWEACGTSGMKALVNGGINLSVLDGWWAEAYSPEVGWSFGDDKEHGDGPEWDRADADSLYAQLEREVIPEFYARNAAGIPEAWVNRMRDSMARLTPRYSANRVVREYTELHYLPAADRFRARSDNRAIVGTRMARLKRELDQRWPRLRIDSMTISTLEDSHLFSANLNLAGISPDNIHVELYAEPTPTGTAERHAMKLVGGPADAADGLEYRTTIPALRPASDYTLRVLPDYRVSVPLEDSHIAWRR